MLMMLASTDILAKSAQKVAALPLRILAPGGSNKLPVYCARNSSTWQTDATVKIVPAETRVHRIIGPYAPSSTPKIVSARVSSDQLTVQTSSGTQNDYPIVWLRDNCQCPDCYNSSSMARSFLMESLDLSVGIDDVSVTLYGDVAVTWTDGHQSTYAPDWLQERAFTEEARQGYRNKHSLPKKHWSRGHEVAQFEYGVLMADDSALLEWLCTLEIYGAALVRNTPGKPNATQDLCERTARVQYTHYGDFSQVKSKPEANNLAFTDTALNLHNDMTTYVNMPGLIFLHMIKTHAGEGGNTVLSDGFMVAEELRRLHPEHFRVLSHTDVYFVDKGKTEPGVKIESFYKITKGPSIQLDNQGAVVKIQINNQIRDSHLDMPSDRVSEFYEALKTYCDLLHEHSVQFKMQDGDMTVLDNLRCQHGRTAYCGATSGRHLINTYMSWDEAACRRRRLQEQLGKQ